MIPEVVLATAGPGPRPKSLSAGPLFENLLLTKIILDSFSNCFFLLLNKI